MLILGLETSTTWISLGLCQDNNILGEVGFSAPRSHLENIHVWLEYLLQQTNQKVADIDLLACNIGPGYFTTLRIGIAVVQALALALHKPILAANSLELLAFQSPLCSELTAIMHSTQQSFFYAHYAQGICTQPPQLGTIQQIMQSHPKKNWATPHQDELQKAINQYASMQDTTNPDISCNISHTNDEIIIPTITYIQPRGAVVAQWAWQHDNNAQKIEHPWDLQPLYLRPARAEELMAKN